MEGKQDIVEAEHVKQKKTPTATASGTHVDSSGKAFILDKNMNEAFYLASPNMQPAAPMEFIGLATDVMSPAFMDSLTKGDKFEYESFLAMEPEPVASVDWCKYTNPDVDIAAISVCAPTGPCTVISTDAGSFFLDTGATTHISPCRNNFFDLCPIPPWSVKGVGGSSIQAVGIGTVKLVIGRGAHILLPDILFIPNTSVCLISISSLCCSAKFIAYFDEDSCWLKKKDGSWVASGVLGKSRSCYYLNGAAPSIDHAFISPHHAPDLETWHHCIGHTNYQSIINMTCLGHQKPPNCHPSFSASSCLHRSRL